MAKTARPCGSRVPRVPPPARVALAAAREPLSPHYTPSFYSPSHRAVVAKKTPVVSNLLLYKASLLAARCRVDRLQGVRSISIALGW
jgi:hypothetical protein